MKTTNLWPFEPSALWPFSTPPARIVPVPVPWMALALAACAAPSPPAEGAAHVSTVTFAGEHGARARVTRARASDGSETLHGETEIPAGDGARRCVVEDVHVDAAGRLASADVAAGASCAGEPDLRAHLDPASGAVRVRTSAGVTDGRAPVAAPWIYTPEVLPGRAIATPVAAWVAARAAGAAPSLTLVQLDRREAWQLPRDQVAIPTELGTTVVLGWDGADVDGTFVERVRLFDLGTTLVREPILGEPTS